MSTNALTLTWTASTDPTVAGRVTSGVVGYRAYLNGVQQIPGPVGLVTSYQFTGLQPSTTYTLGLEAVDAAGNVSARATVQGTTQAAGTGWPTQTQSYMSVLPNLAGYGCNTLAGYGVNTRGDNVQVLYVTTLANSGTGSYREVLARNIGGAARVVVFNVEGYVNLSDLVQIPPGLNHVTIAGQTAPGKGICLRGGTHWVQVSDVLMQHLHVRPGDASTPGLELWSNRIGINIYHFGTPTPQRVVIDHCSVAWNGDEGIITYSHTADVTVANCIAMQGLNGPQSKSCNVSGGSDANPNRIAFIRNLFGHCVQRHPRISCPEHIFVNNVVYNWSDTGTSIESRNGTLDNSFVTARGNYYKHGPNSGASLPFRIKGSTYTDQAGGGTRLYLDDNRLNGALPGSQLSLCNFESPHLPGTQGVVAPNPMPVWHTGVVPASSADAYGLVLAGAGAFSANRDALDAQLVAMATNGTSSGFNSTNNPTAWPTYGSATIDHTTGPDPIPDGAGGRPAPGTINGATGRTLIEEWCNRRAAEKQAV